MAQTAATKTPISPGLIARLIRGVRYTIGGSSANALDDWFGPGQPNDPMAQEAVGRQFDYPTGYNYATRPRNYDAISFVQLRALADNYDLVRLLIEKRKDQICNLTWKIAPKDDSAQPDDRCKAIEAFMQTPDQDHSWQAWLRMVLEDMLVIDATTIYPRLTNGGELYALEPVDGATIKRVLDEAGRTPLPPDPAYQQVLKGFAAIDYTRDELIYVPRNPRTNRVYGYSPVEQIIMTVNIAIRRQIHQLQFYTEGSMPEALISVPAEWNPDQIAQFQRYFDDMLSGNTGERRRARFITGGSTIFETKAGALKDDYDDWLARICCFAFSIEPTPFIRQQNRSTSDTAREQSLADGLIPIKNWVKSLMDRVIAKDFGVADLCFTWEDEEAIDPLVQAEINQIYIDAGVLDPDEVRVDTLGKPAMTPEQREKLAPPPMPAPPPDTMQDGMTEPGPTTAAPPGSPPPAKGKAIEKLQKKKPSRRSPLAGRY